MKGRLGLGLGLGLLVGGLAIALFPYRTLLWPFGNFAYRYAEPGFEVYASSPFDSAQTSQRLDTVVQRLKQAEITLSNPPYLLFLCQDTATYAHFAELAGMGRQSQGFHLSPVGYTFINLPMIAELGERHRGAFPHTLLSGSQAHVVTHELVHRYLFEQKGFREARALPGWKVEGYCEYVAAGSLPLAEQLFDQCLSREFRALPQARQAYLIDHLLATYALEEEELDLEEWLADPRSRAEWQQEVAATRKDPFLSP